MLNEYFHNVCELDLVFNFYKVNLHNKVTIFVVLIYSLDVMLVAIQVECFLHENISTLHYNYINNDCRFMLLFALKYYILNKGDYCQCK